MPRLFANAVIVVPLDGELDISRYPVFREAFAVADPAAQAVIVDLRRVTSVDSTFLMELMLFMRRMERARVVVVFDSANIARIFEITELGNRIEIFRTLDEAKRALSVTAKRARG